jgi:hypothetical protein
MSIEETTSLTRESRRLEPLVAEIGRLQQAKQELRDIEAMLGSADKARTVTRLFLLFV